jgi:hypothetical protein
MLIAFVFSLLLFSVMLCLTGFSSNVWYAHCFRASGLTYLNLSSYLSKCENV